MNKVKLLEVKQVTKLFSGIVALDKVDFSLEEGSVHGICGENGAGKSTLMHIMMGVHQKDHGEILFKGKPADLRTPRHALATGIAIIEQELSPIPDMTIAENIFLGREPVNAKFFIDYGELNELTKQVLQELDILLDPTYKMKRLSLAEVQLIEIAKAISYDTEILIMDEPTSAIGEKEIDRLTEVITYLKNKGKGIIYVSHKLDEVLDLTDRITVLRDSLQVKTINTDDVTKTQLVELMMGNKIKSEFCKRNHTTDKEMLSVKNLGKKGKFEDVSLKVRAGEVLGIFGLMGSGRSEFLDSLFGVIPADTGTIYVENQPVKIKFPIDAIKHGLAYVTEDRKETGLILTSSVKENITIASLKEVSNRFFIDSNKEEERVRKMVDVFGIKISSVRQLIKNLSGGNQQKVVLSKWLSTSPKILLVDEPTRGIDVGAKQDVYNFITQEANRGTAIIMVSSELPELMTVCDHVAVFKNGRMVKQFDLATAKQEQIMRVAA